MKLSLGKNATPTTTTLAQVADKITSKVSEIANLKFNLSKKSSQLSMDSLSQMTAKTREDPPACLGPHLQVIGLPPQGAPQGASSPPQGCIWIYIHCDEASSFDVLGVYQFCGAEIPALSAWSVENMNNFQYISGVQYHRTLKGNLSGIRLGPYTTVDLWANDNYEGTTTKMGPSTAFMSTCANGWNDKPNSLKVTVTPPAAIEEPPASLIPVVTPLPTLKNVSNSLVGPTTGCIFIYVHCGEQLSKDANGIYEACIAQNLSDLSQWSISDLTDFTSISGKTLFGNVSGVKLGTFVETDLFENINYTGNFKTIATEGSFVNLCGVSKGTGTWNDQPKSMQILAPPMF